MFQVGLHAHEESTKGIVHWLSVRTSADCHGLCVASLSLESRLHVFIVF